MKIRAFREGWGGVRGQGGQFCATCIHEALPSYLNSSGKNHRTMVFPAPCNSVMSETIDIFCRKCPAASFHNGKEMIRVGSECCAVD